MLKFGFPFCRFDIKMWNSAHQNNRISHFQSTALDFLFCFPFCRLDMKMFNSALQNNRISHFQSAALDLLLCFPFCRLDMKMFNSALQNNQIRHFISLRHLLQSATLDFPPPGSTPFRLAMAYAAPLLRSMWNSSAGMRLTWRKFTRSTNATRWLVFVSFIL